MLKPVIIRMCNLIFKVLELKYTLESMNELYNK